MQDRFAIYDSRGVSDKGAWRAFPASTIGTYFVGLAFGTFKTGFKKKKKTYLKPFFSRGGHFFVFWQLKGSLGIFKTVFSNSFLFKVFHFELFSFYF